MTFPNMYDAILNLVSLRFRTIPYELLGDPSYDVIPYYDFHAISSSPLSPPLLPIYRSLSPINCTWYSKNDQNKNFINQSLFILVPSQISLGYTLILVINIINLSIYHIPYTILNVCFYIFIIFIMVFFYLLWKT